MSVKSVVRTSACIGTLVILDLVAPHASAQTDPDYQAALARVLQDPASSEASFVFAQTAASSGDFRGSIAALERVLILNPDLANIKLELGVLYLRLGQTALAEQFIREALKSPDAPPEVRVRAQELLDLAEAENDPLTFSVWTNAGLITDSNANSGPASGVVPEDAGQADISAFLRLDSRLAYDLGTQAGHQLIAGLDYYGRRYSEQHQVNLDRLGLSLGALLNIAPEELAAQTLRLTLDATYYWRGGQRFLNEVGPVALFGFSLSETAVAELGAFYFHQDYQNTTEYPVNDERDGALYGLSASVRQALSDTQLLSYGLRLSEKSANVPYDAYQSVGVSLGYTVVADALAAFGGETWRYGLNGAVGFRWYDGPDPATRIGEAEEAASYFFSGSVEIPFDNGLALLTEVGVDGNSSNYAFNEFDNVFLSVSIGKKF